jgi:hypothetical protein
MQKNVAAEEVFSNTSKANSVGPGTGPSSKVRYNVFSSGDSRHINDGYK